MQFCIKIEKSPQEHLCDHTSSPKHRTITPFALEDTNDPKQSPKYQQYVSKYVSII